MALLDEKPDAAASAATAAASAVILHAPRVSVLHAIAYLERRAGDPASAEEARAVDREALDLLRLALGQPGGSRLL